MSKKAPLQADFVLDSLKLSQYLRVFNRRTGRELGYIGNINRNGLMLITRWRMQTGKTFNMRIVLPQPYMGKTFIDFDARCQWCQPDIDGESFDSGYAIVQTSIFYDSLIEALVRFFSFRTE